MKSSNVCRSILLGSIMLLPAVTPALASFSFAVSTTQVLPTTFSLANAPLGNGGNGGGLYTAGGVTVYLGGSPSGQGVVMGAMSSQYAPPIVLPAGNATQNKYLSTGIGTDIFTFATPQKQFSLLWGSVDAYNTLSFYNSASPNATSVPATPVFSITGSQVVIPANGNQGPSGSRYVTVQGGTFNQVEFLSTQPSFETTSFSSTATPEPAFLGMLGAGLAGLAAASRLRHRKTSEPA